MHKIAVGKDQSLVVFSRTVGGDLDSIPTWREAVDYAEGNRNYQSDVEEEFGRCGHGEGLANLLELVKSVQAGYQEGDIIVVVCNC